MTGSILFLALALAGDSHAAGKPAAKPLANVEDRKPSAAPAASFCIFGGQSGKPFGDLASFKSVVWKSDVVYAGGDPARAGDQAARLDILRSMREARSSKIAVGFETLDMSLQPVLDDYAGGRITEEDFLQKTGWQTGSAVDFAAYRPIFYFIIQNKLRALALNVPAPVIFKIEREGLAGLNADDKKFLPAQLAVTKSKKYLDLLAASFTAAGPLTLENRVAAVSAWNEGAGARIAEFTAANPAYELLVLAGNDRLAYNAGLPASVKSRAPKLRQASFYLEDGAKCPAELPKEKKDLANYVWYIDHTPKAVPAAPAAPAQPVPAKK